MRVKDCTAETVPEGTRIRVTAVASSEAEQAGYVSDAKRLVGQTGTVQSLNEGGTFSQLNVNWDDETINLMLAGLDHFEVVA